MKQSSLLCALVVLSTTLLLMEFSHSAESQPNIILMMGDDHGWEETGYNGHPYLKTPVLDEMAATGVRLEHFYSTHPSCSPTRAGFLTGRHPNRMGTFIPNMSFRPEEITIAHLAKQAGYQCGHFGKWHVGPVRKDSPVSPLAMGFDESLAHDNFFDLNPTFSRNGGAPEVFKGESSAILADETIRYIDKVHAEGKPFFVVLWFGSPHEPYQGLPEDLALYDELPAKYPEPMVKLTSVTTGLEVKRPLGEVLRERYAEITAMDRAIGTLRTHLKDSGLRDNTIVFYCGDNGTSADGLLKSPHRGKKADHYEGGVRVPGVFEWPARVPEPTTVTLRASTSDILPTLADIMGVPVPNRPLDGIDLVPLLSKQVSQRPSPLFFWSFNLPALEKQNPEPYIDPELQKGTTPLLKLTPDGQATRNFKNFRLPLPITKVDYTGTRAVIDGDYKLIILRDKKVGKEIRELYNLEADPGETTDLAAKHPDLVKSLDQKMHLWQDSVLNSLTGADYSK